MAESENNRPFGSGDGGAAAEENARLEEVSTALNIPLQRNIAEVLDIDQMPSELPIQHLKRWGFVPLHQRDGVLTVAVNDPRNFPQIDDLARQLGCESTRWVLSPREEILAAINRLYDRSDGDARKIVADLGELRGIEDSSIFSELEELEDILDVNHEAPIIQAVNVILTQALRRKASDIHIEPFQNDIRVRFRIDGLLYETFELPKRLHAHIVSRLKVMANLDIAEKRVPQDGRIKVKVADRLVDIRVSVIPMAFGERIVLRLLDKGATLIDFEHIGMDSRTLGRFENLITKSMGILLVTGPTGSGKTTTLYTAISRISSSEKNIITIEDPIEYELKGVGQIQTNPRTGLSFARGLRSILRHDPDVIMVGEIRDLETAEIAVQASLTGHLVFSTLHTNDAAGALTRLVDMGVEPFLIASSLLGVLAQRLVRVICPDCKEPYVPEKELLTKLEMPEDTRFHWGRGCEECLQTGYRGRTGIFELLIMENEIRELLKTGSDAVTIKEAACRLGMTTLFEDGLAKVRGGITTLNEVLRVSQE
jgi:general secretion pathway protein E